MLNHSPLRILGACILNNVLCTSFCQDVCPQRLCTRTSVETAVCKWWKFRNNIDVREFKCARAGMRSDAPSSSGNGKQNFRAHLRMQFTHTPFCHWDSQDVPSNCRGQNCFRTRTFVMHVVAKYFESRTATFLWSMPRWKKINLKSDVVADPIRSFCLVWYLKTSSWDVFESLDYVDIHLYFFPASTHLILNYMLSNLTGFGTWIDVRCMLLVAVVTIACIFLFSAIIACIFGCVSTLGAGLKCIV